ncbi:hypothetical protein J7J56_04975 [candidate division WOR-3 bacterium]|nr:hypothetical protein [candidate division WOR-3 bacterium]
MIEVLKDLIKLKGVYGAFISDNKGNIIAYDMPPGYEKDAMEEASHTVLRIVEGLDTVGCNVDHILWEYDEYRFISRKVKDGFISVLCSKTISLPLLNLSLNVIVKQINEGLIKVKPHENKKKELPPELAVAVDTSVFNTIEQELTKFIGPVAEILITRKIRELGEERDNFPRGRLEELIDSLSAEIDNEEERELFKKRMSDILSK